MPLRIKLPPKERIIINGAVIENAGGPTTVLIHNQSDILRRREVMMETEADTPSRRIYFVIQSAYLFRDERSSLLQTIRDLLQEFAEAAPSAEETVQRIREEIHDDRFYEALKTARTLIELETEILEAYRTVVKPDDPAPAT